MYMYIYTLLRSCTRDCECEKKIYQIYLEESSFPMVFLRAKDADAAVLHLFFLSLDILLNIDLGILNRETKNRQYLLKDSKLVLSRPKPVTPSPPWPHFQKKIHVKTGQFKKK